MFLPVIPVSDAKNFDSDLQLAKTAMSPVKHSWKHRHRQRTGPRKKGTGMFLPVMSRQKWKLATLRFLQWAKTAMSPVEKSRKLRQRTGPREKGPRRNGAGIFLPMIPVFGTQNSNNDLQLASTLMSPMGHSWKHRHRQRTGPRKKGAWMFLPAIPVSDEEKFESDLQSAKTAMSPVEDLRKRHQRTGSVMSELVHERRVRECSYRCTEWRGGS
jgi:hypothetical protein